MKPFLTAGKQPHLLLHVPFSPQPPERGPKLISLKKRKVERPHGRSRTIVQRKYAPGKNLCNRFQRQGDILTLPFRT